MRFIVNYVVYLFVPMFAFVNKCMHFLIFAPDSMFCLFALFFCSFLLLLLFLVVCVVFLLLLIINCDVFVFMS